MGMILGSHDSITYKKPSCILLMPFAYMAKCQNLNLYEQYKFGYRCFDLRIRFNIITKQPYLCHGIATYSGNVEEIIEKLLFLHWNADTPLYIRIGFENIFPWCSMKQYTEYIKTLKAKYASVKFMFCIKKPKWTIIENNFDKPFIEVQTVPDIHTIWDGPYKLKERQTQKIVNWENKDVIVSGDFLDEIVL